MEYLNDIVNQLVEDIEMPEDVPVAYEVWAIGYDEDGVVDTSEMYVTAFTDPDEAVAYAKSLTATEVLSIAEDNLVGRASYANIEGIIIEVETTVLDDSNDSVSIGTIYRNKLELFEEQPDFICLSSTDYMVIEETGYIQVPCNLLNNYKKDDEIQVLFTDEERPWPITYKIIAKTTDGDFICDFV